MDRFILKEKIEEYIGNGKVQAALFHTFNFDPRFFENYVMPLLVKGNEFKEEIIYNKILWRNLLKEGLIPPISVFCDYFAKDNTESPSLDYDIHCIKTPSAKGHVCNFHPKHIFILFEEEQKDKSTIEKLLFITGSGNLTAGGWCDNFECFSSTLIEKNKTYPNHSTTNALQEMISDVGFMAGLKYLSEAEAKIHNFLKYVDLDVNYFSSLSQPFTEFLEEEIFENDSIKEVEIISPYFSNDTLLVEYLKSCGIGTIKCLIPTLRTNEVQMEKEYFINMQDAGLLWSRWSSSTANTEIRNQHSKIYRFYGEELTYTIIGSVNFTKPAWDKYKKNNNCANVESAVLYKEKNNTERILNDKIKIDIEQMHFFSKEDLESTEEQDEEEVLDHRYPPQIDFTIYWKRGLLEVKSIKDIPKCRFHGFHNLDKVCNGNIYLSDKDIKKLTRNSLIEVSEETNNGLVIHYYYPNQEEIEAKPLGFNLDVFKILKLWEYLIDENKSGDYYREILIRDLSEKMTDESGGTDEKRIKNVSLLNEIAAHYSGLVILENYLFLKTITTKTQQAEQFKRLNYYLLSENIDTVSFYLNDLNIKLTEGKIQKSLYWMILQILVNVYAKAENREYRHLLEKKDRLKFKSDIKAKKKEFENIAGTIIKDIPGLKEKEEWVLEQLNKTYE